jgi:hypothetical protein
MARQSSSDATVKLWGHTPLLTARGLTFGDKKMKTKQFSFLKSIVFKMACPTVMNGTLHPPDKTCGTKGIGIRESCMEYNECGTAKADSIVDTLGFIF